ncbi:hypothetical protein DMUE_2871 [Dictyocoela muelleri]|nr:hypothetical protein DMUE_2871 [Dictyocoela muelleri]
MKKSKIKEAFYYGQSRRTQLEMIRLNIHDIDSMYTLIDTTLIEQYESITKIKHQRREKTTDFKGNSSHKKSNFCKFHKTSTHDSLNFRALKRQNNHVNDKTPRNNIGKNERNMFIQEPKIKAQQIRIDIKIKGKNYQFLIYTVSVYSYIDESLILENDLKVQ